MTRKTQKTNTTTSKATEYALILKHADNNKTFATIKGDIAKRFLILSEKLKTTPSELFESIVNKEYEKKHGKTKS